METKRLIETENSIQEFTVRFYGGTVMIEQNQLPLGQISFELLDYPTEELLALHDEAVRLFSIVRDSLFARDKEKSPALAAAVQCQLNRALKHVYPLPLFSLLNIDRDLCVIPNVAIHFNREINKGFAYNPQVDLLPLYGGGVRRKNSRKP